MYTSFEFNNCMFDVIMFCRPVPVATVLFEKHPVAVVYVDNSGHYEYKLLWELGAEKEREELLARFQMAYGGANVDFLEYTRKVNMNKAFEDVEIDDGHEWCAFCGEVCKLMHSIWPSYTPEPTGF